MFGISLTRVSHQKTIGQSPSEDAASSVVICLTSYKRNITLNHKAMTVNHSRFIVTIIVTGAVYEPDVCFCN